MGLTFAFWTIAALALGFIAGRASMRDEMRSVVYSAARDVAAEREQMAAGFREAMRKLARRGEA